MTFHTVIVLGGNSKGNIAWVDGMRKWLAPHFNVITHEYTHWISGNPDIDFELELVRLRRLIEQNNFKEYSIVAKSAGLLLSLIGIQRKILAPVSVTGFGLPLEYAAYRRVVPEMMTINTTRMLLVQGDKDPQGSADGARQIISKDTLLIQIRSDNHAYDRFRELSEYARVFIEIYQPAKYRNISEVHGKSLRGILPNVFASQKQYSLLSNWLYDPYGRIRSFTYNTKSYMAKSAPPRKATEEVKAAREASKRLSGVSIGGRSLRVSVPCLFRLSRTKVSYLVSEYHGATCNEQFYLSSTTCHSVLSADEIKLLAEVLAERGITYPGFLPRNTIVVKDNIYLIDWEGTIFDSSPVLLDEATKTNYLIGWSYVRNIAEAFDASAVFSENSESSSAEEYEKAFFEMMGAEQISDDVRSQSYALAISGEVHERADDVGGRLKRDDVVCAISPFIPIEVEVLIDTLLAREKKLHADTLYYKLSNCVRQAIVSNHAGATSEDPTRAFIKSLRSTLKEYLKANDTSALKVIHDLYEDADPDKRFMAKVQLFL